MKTATECIVDNMGIVFGPLFADKSDWLAARMNALTASDVAAVLGEGRSMKIDGEDVQATRESVARVKAGLEPDFAGSEATELGTLLEPVVADYAKSKWGWRMEPFGRLVRLVGVPLAATPDYVMQTPYGPATVQVKVTSCQPTDRCKPSKSGKPSEAAYANGAPLYHQLQIQAELAVLGWQHGVLLVLHSSALCVRAYYVPRHDAVIARIIDEAPRFMREVEALKARFA